MAVVVGVLVVVAVVLLLDLALAVRIVQQYERGVLFRLGIEPRVIASRTEAQLDSRGALLTWSS